IDRMKLPVHGQRTIRIEPDRGQKTAFHATFMGPQLAIVFALDPHYLAPLDFLGAHEPQIDAQRLLYLAIDDLAIADLGVHLLQVAQLAVDSLLLPNPASV